MDSSKGSLFWNGSLDSVPDLPSVCSKIRERIHLISKSGGNDLQAVFNGEVSSKGNNTLVATLPPLYPEWLGDRSFQEVHNCRFPYIGGAMAKGIASIEMVIALARGGMLGFFGSAGLSFPRVNEAVDQIQAALGPDGLSYGFNLINSPHEPELEDALVDLYLEKKVHRISAAAYMNISEPLVRYRLSGIKLGADGQVIPTNFIFAKISRPEVAQKFLSPPPAKIIKSLLSKGRITQEQADIAALIPMAEDITVEGDSGGHTDNPAFDLASPHNHGSARQAGGGT